MELDRAVVHDRRLDLDRRRLLRAARRRAAQPAQRRDGGAVTLVAIQRARPVHRARGPRLPAHERRLRLHGAGLRGPSQAGARGSLAPRGGVRPERRLSRRALDRLRQRPGVPLRGRRRLDRLARRSS